MSILMQALKQQHQSVPTSADSGAFWRKLALVLALLLASCVGALAAYWLTPQQPPASAAAPDPAVTPAVPATIVAALTVSDTDKASNKDNTSDKDSVAMATASQDIVAALPTQLQRQLANTLTPPAEPVKEQFVSPPPVASVTAGTAAAEPQPLADSAISGELRDKFASALKATESGSSSPERNHTAPATDIHSLAPQLQQQIPPLRFDAHVYATTVSQRWVKVNGKTLQEGQWITADIRIKEITPQFVLLQLGEQLFSMAALSEWPAG